MPDLERQSIGMAFEQMATPTGFYMGMYQTPESNIVRNKKILFDIKRNGEQYAVDVIRGAGGRGNINKRFTTKEYEPPFYNEFSWVSQDERLLRALGRTEYDENSMTDVLAAIVRGQLLHDEKIQRSEEKQCVDALFLGKITLVNHDTIDFKQKATHKISPSVDWSHADGDPDADLQGACDLNRKDGKSTSNIVEFSPEAFKLYQNNVTIKEKTNFRRTDRIDLRPPRPNADGANFHGWITVGDYELEVWTYPQFYTVPEGYGLPNEGTQQPYIPANKLRVGNKNSRFDLVYAGIPKLTPMNDPRLSAIGIDQAPLSMRGRRHLYGIVDPASENVKYGVKSAPLAIPTDMDSSCVLTVA